MALVVHDDGPWLEITGYRPGGLDRHGLAPEALLGRHPGLVVARLRAWGPAGPWAAWRGFDSLVQAACGIAVVEGSPDAPGALPAQALDHGTGYLLAAAVLRALTQRSAIGGGWHAELSLAQTAAWLLRLPPTMPAGPTGVEPWLRQQGPFVYADSPLPGSWSLPTPWGSDAPQWSPGPS